MKTQLPHQTDSIEELARFWGTRDLTDFEHQLEEVTDSIFAHATETTMTVRLKLKEAEAVKRIAKSKGVEQTTLMREWILEKLQAA